MSLIADVRIPRVSESDQCRVDCSKDLQAFSFGDYGGIIWEILYQGIFENFAKTCSLEQNRRTFLKEQSEELTPPDFV